MPVSQEVGITVESKAGEIHPTAIISPQAKIGPGVTIGPYSVIGPKVVIKEDTFIGPHVIIDGITEIGSKCKLIASCSIGLPPQDINYKGEETGVKIGDGTVIREYVTIHRATKEGYTVVGNNCFLMNYVHIGHNCQIENNVIIVNATMIGGYVVVEDFVVIGGNSAIHQYCRVGESSIVGGMTGCRLDIPPYFIADGSRAIIRGVNVVGLRRRGIKAEIREELKKAYKIIHLSNLNTKEALGKIEKELTQYVEITKLVNFYRTSKRGITKKNTEQDNQEDPDIEN